MSLERFERGSPCLGDLPHPRGLVPAPREERFRPQALGKSANRRLVALQSAYQRTRRFRVDANCRVIAARANPTFILQVVNARDEICVVSERRV